MKKKYGEDFNYYIADAIRLQTNLVSTYKVSDMASAIRGISTYDQAKILAERSQTIYSMSSISWICSSAFYSYSKLRNVSFPNAIYVFESAFEYCTNLQSVSLPRLESAEKRVFYACSNLARINLPTLSYLGGEAFAKCKNLISANLPVLKATTYNGSDKLLYRTFSGCENLKAVYAPKIRKLDGTFTDCHNLTTFNFDNITEIEGSCFYNCYRMTNGYFPNLEYISFTYYSSSAFYSEKTFGNCSALTYFSAPKLSGNFNGYCFSGCQNISSVNIPKVSGATLSPMSGVLRWLSASSVSNIQLSGCSLLANYQYFPNLSGISPYTFADCKLLPGLSIPNVETVSSWAFLNCTGLTTISFPKVSRFYPNAFYDGEVTYYNPYGGIFNIYTLPSVIIYNPISASIYSSCTNLKTIYLGTHIHAFQDFGLPAFKVRGLLYGYSIYIEPEVREFADNLINTFPIINDYILEYSTNYIHLTSTITTKVNDVMTELASMLSDDPRYSYFVSLNNAFHMLAALGLNEPLYSFTPVSDGRIYVPATEYDEWVSRYSATGFSCIINAY